MVRILIREGQSPNEQTLMFGNSPLHIAAHHGHLLIVKYLLEQGALATCENEVGKKRPIDVAQDQIDLQKEKLRT